MKEKFIEAGEIVNTHGVRGEVKIMPWTDTPEFLRAFDFRELDASKNWFDVTLSHEALKAGFRNYVFANLPVWHRPHGSRPWKQLKYKNPLKYYWLKYTKGLDKI